MSPKRYEQCWIVSIGFALLCTVLSGIVYRTQPFEILKQVSVNQPLVFEQKEDYEWLAISGVVVSDRCVYAVYKYNDFVQAYDLDGDYLCTIAVKDGHKHGGVLNAYAHEDMLYLDLARSGDVYEFKDQVFMRRYDCMEEHEMDDFLRENNELFQRTVDAEGWEYYIDGVGISRRNSDGTTEVFVERRLEGYVGARLLVLIAWLPMLGLWIGYRKKHNSCTKRYNLL